MNEQYIFKVKVVNNNRGIFDGVRHIIWIDDTTTIEEVKSWYYEHFEKLNGDEFIIVDKDGSEHYE